MNQTKKNSAAKQYHRFKIILFFLDFLMTATFLFLFVLLRGGHALQETWVARVSTFWIQVLLYATSLAVFLYFLELPIHIFGDYLLEKRVALSTLTFSKWCVKELKRAMLSLFFFVVVVETAYCLLWIMGGGWWIGFGALWFIYSWVLTHFFPVWIVPLFYRYSAVQDETLVTMLKTFATAQKSDIDSVRVLNLSKDTRKANAAVLGLGKRKRVVLGDTLLRNFSHEEIKVIFAHELGHDKEHHLLVSLCFNSLVIFGGVTLIQKILNLLLPYLDLNSVADLAVLPLFLFLFACFTLLAMPVQNGFSRSLERRADLFALRATGLKDVFVSAMKKLAAQNLSDETPHRLTEFFLYSHPSISRRIEFAKKF